MYTWRLRLRLKLSSQLRKCHVLRLRGVNRGIICNRRSIQSIRGFAHCIRSNQLAAERLVSTQIHYNSWLLSGLKRDLLTCQQFILANNNFRNFEIHFRKIKYVHNRIIKIAFHYVRLRGELIVFTDEMYCTILPAYFDREAIMHNGLKGLILRLGTLVSRFFFLPTTSNIIFLLHFNFTPCCRLLLSASRYFRT